MQKLLQAHSCSIVGVKLKEISQRLLKTYEASEVQKEELMHCLLSVKKLPKTR